MFVFCWSTSDVFIPAFLDGLFVRPGGDASQVDGVGGKAFQRFKPAF